MKAKGENSIRQVAERMDDFEAGESQPNTGTGSRREGAGFERLVGEYWEQVRRAAVAGGAACDFATETGRREWAALSVGGRVLYLPHNPAAPSPPQTHQQPSWFEVAFDVADFVAAYPGTANAISRYAPPSGPYAGDSYPEMYAGLSTGFDDTIVLEQDGVLFEKILLEYKTAKPKHGKKVTPRVDANAHERLTFQTMQYLEAATRYPACSLMVIANGAFSRYRNKYHVQFHVQADRLRAFKWFQMEHLSNAAEYERAADGLLNWLRTGEPRTKG